VNVLLSSTNDVLRRSITEALREGGHDVHLAVENSLEAAMPRPAGVEAASDHPGAAVFVDPGVTQLRQHSGHADTQAGRAVFLRAAAQSGLRRVIEVRRRRLSRQESERDAHTFPDGVLTIEVSPVYGVGDDPVTILLLMMRSLPVIPLSTGTHVACPLWHRDLAETIAAAVTLSTSAPETTIDVVGPEAITVDQLYERIASHIGRRPLRIPVPEFLADHGARLAEALNVTEPLATTHALFQETLEVGSCGTRMIPGLQAPATSIDYGLRALVAELEELTPADGVGTLEVKQFFADMQTRLSAADVLRRFRDSFAMVMPVDVAVEPASQQTRLAAGANITMALPGRGHVQVRVVDASDEQIVLSTVRGHVLAGIVRFRTQAAGDLVRFEVLTCDTAANPLDWIGLTLGGARLQDANWTKVVHNVARLAGDDSVAVESVKRKLPPDEAQAVKAWLESTIEAYRTTNDRRSWTIR